MSFTINFLRAAHGDCILITNSDNIKGYRILVDGGPKICFEKKQGAKKTEGPLKKILDSILALQKTIDLTVLTHVDDDHIAGLLEACRHEKYRELIREGLVFNSGAGIAGAIGTCPSVEARTPLLLHDSTLTGISQGVDLDEILLLEGGKKRKICVSGDIIKVGDAIIHILSPELAQLKLLLKKWKQEAPDSLTSETENDYKLSFKRLIEDDRFVEDKSIHNGSSIAFLIETKDASALFLGDAWPSVVSRSLKKLGYSSKNPVKVDLCKLSHHGSQANTSKQLLSIIDSERYVISTNGQRHGLPNKRTIARIFEKYPNCKIFFNYPELIDKIFTKEERDNLGEKLQALGNEIRL